MKTIKLLSKFHGKVAKIDDSDYELISSFHWSFHKTKNGEYARTWRNEGGKNKFYLMHRIILCPPRGVQVDHQNMNGLDNRRSNLRLCNHSENMCNRRPRKDSTSKIKGVGFVKRINRWQVRIQKDNKRIYLGIFLSRKKAVETYNNVAQKLHGQFARLNPL
jgi:hypothetical protein